MQTVRNRVLLLKEEASYGVDSNPTIAANAIEVANLKLNFQADLLDRNNVRSNISQTNPVVGKRWVEVSFDAEIKGSGSKGVAARLGDAFEACSFAEYAVAGSSVAYKPTSSNQKTATIYIYDNDNTGSSVLHKITAAQGSFSIKATAGKYGVFSFTFKGLYNEPTDVVNPGSPTYDTTVPPIVENCAFTLNSNTDLIVQELSIDIANNIGSRDDISSANGIKNFMVTSRAPKGNFNPEATLVADYNFWSDWVGATQRELSLVIGSASGNKVTISAPKVTLDSIADGERESLLTREIPFTLGQDSGDDEVEIKFE